MAIPLKNYWEEANFLTQRYQSYTFHSTWRQSVCTEEYEEEGDIH